jgi:Domain of unknown function (DUF4395)
MRLAAWMDSNLATQGYCLSPEESRHLRLGLRLSTALCLVLGGTGLALESAALLFALSGIGLVAGFTRRHPFDLIWNHALRRAFGAPAVPPSPPRRRHAFKLATAWLLAIAVLFAAGASTAALALGVALLAACSVVTVANFCIPSELMALWARLTSRRLEATP